MPGVTIGIMGMSGSSVQCTPNQSYPVPQFSARSPMALGMIICNKLGWCGMKSGRSCRSMRRKFSRSVIFSM